MSADQIASLAYMSLLLVAVAGWFIAQNRNGIGKTAQMAVTWGLIFLGVIAAKGLWDDIRKTTVPFQSVATDGKIEIPRAPDGHFYAVLKLNGKNVEFVIDTGATHIVLTENDARKIGLNPDGLAFLGRAETANGPVQIAYAKVNEISFGPYRDENISVSISKSDMGMSLLGMSYLGRFDLLQIANDRLILQRNSF